MPTFCLVGVSIGIWPSDKKGRRKGPWTVLFLCLATNLQKPQKRKQRSRLDALTIVCCSSSSMWCCCNCGQLQKQQTKKSWHQWFNWLEKPKNEERNSCQCQPFLSSWHFNQYTAKPQKREKQGQGCQWFHSFGQQPTCQNPQKEAKKQRGHLDNCLQLLLWHVVSLQLQRTPKTKKSQCLWFDWLSLQSRWMLKNPKKGKKMENNKCQPFVWLACWFVYGWATKKGEWKGCRWFRSFAWQPTCRNPKTGSREADWMPWQLFAAPLLACGVVATVDNTKNNKSQCKQFDQSSLWSR